MALSEAFQEHLLTGITTLARCWVVTRKDGAVFGFTDHDRDIEFTGVAFKANTGLTARALQQTTGLSIDNSEALGALSDLSVTEADIRAGRFDGAKVEAWLVNWADPEERVLQFRGSLGDITRASGGFRAELVGLSEAMNQPQGHVFQTPCSAVLGDARCRVDLGDLSYSDVGLVAAILDQKIIALSGLDGFAEDWFLRGRITVTSGKASGIAGVVKRDRIEDGLRVIELWEALRSDIALGDTVRVSAGCDKHHDTCVLKFDNILNFRGFPDIPGEDRALSIPSPVAGTVQGGGK